MFEAALLLADGKGGDDEIEELLDRSIELWHVIESPWMEVARRSTTGCWRSGRPRREGAREAPGDVRPASRRAGRGQDGGGPSPARGALVGRVSSWAGGVPLAADGVRSTRVRARERPAKEARAAEPRTPGSSSGRSGLHRLLAHVDGLAVAWMSSTSTKPTSWLPWRSRKASLPPVVLPEDQEVARVSLEREGLGDRLRRARLELDELPGGRLDLQHGKGRVPSRSRSIGCSRRRAARCSSPRRSSRRCSSHPRPRASPCPRSGDRADRW